VIFSDGIESDCLAFNSGAVAVIRAAEQHTRLVAEGEAGQKVARCCAASRPSRFAGGQVVAAPRKKRSDRR
jgi:hypothetical protein